MLFARRAHVSLALAAALALAACTSKEGDDGARLAADGEALAKVGDHVITTADVERRLERLSPYERARYTSMEQKRELLDNMIRFEVLAQEARRRGFDEHPDVVRSVKEVMIQRMMDDLLTGELDPGDIPEADLRAFYDDHAEEFHRPEEVRASVIVVSDEAQAASLAREAQAASSREFRDLVEAHSIDETTRARGGDLRYFTRDTEELPEALVEAAFAAEAGEVVGPIDGGDGTFFVLKRTGHRPAVERSFEEVVRQVRNRVYRQRRADAQAEFIEELRDQAAVEVREDALRELEIRAGASASEPKGPREAPGEQRP